MNSGDDRARVLVTSWAAFRHGEATAGDVLAVSAVERALTMSEIAHDTSWSPRFRPGAFTLDDAEPSRYTHLVFVCGPLAGWQVESLHDRFSATRRIAVGVSIPDPTDPAVTGFDRILPRDGTADAPSADLAIAAPLEPVPVVVRIQAPAQPEYGPHRRHRAVHAALDEQLSRHSCAVLDLDTRLGPGAPFSRPEEYCAVLGRADVVVTTRLHGLVLALRQGVPAIAVDPIADGAKVSSQADALGWPAVITADAMCSGPEPFDRWWRWCLSGEGREAADRLRGGRRLHDQLTTLVETITAPDQSWHSRT
jgi:hypothetical protein